ncbi:hypothetical protein BC567DRAFT_268340 [Phyllosticta citribraziliensis]
MAITSGDALNHVWRGSLGHHILFGSQTPTWTTEDQRVFLVYAARFKWNADLAPGDVGTKDLQKDLRVYTSHRSLNTAILLSLVTAVKSRLTELQRDQPRVFEWPPYTKNWFLNPLWDGDTAEPPAGVLTTRGIEVDCYPGTGDSGKQTINPLLLWDTMTDDVKQLCFAAARGAAKQSQAMLSDQPISRMVFRLSSTN